MNILLTGASGFLGRRLAYKINSLSSCNLGAVVRSHSASISGECILVDQIDGDTEWQSALIDKDLVIHAAGRTHVNYESSVDPLTVYRTVNVDGTLNLARQAAISGVKRFIFISSIKVNGEETLPGLPFTVIDTPAPENSYSISKLEAEQGLLQIATETELEVVIIRSPLVYGPGVKGNFLNLIKLVANEVPLPFESIRNKRSFVSLDNLVDLIIRCMYHQKAANHIFLAADGEDISTPELFRCLAKAMGKKSRLIPFPVSLLMFSASMLGKKSIAQRLFGSLQVDISKTCECLDWNPPLTFDEGLRLCFDYNSECRVSKVSSLG